MARNGKGNGNGNQRRRGRNARVRRTAAASQGWPFWVKGLLALGILGIGAVLAAGAVAYTVYNNYADELVAPDELAINKPSYGAKIFDRNGKLLYEYVDDQAGLRRPVPVENVSDAFLAATIATEDDTFFTNPGVNYKGLIRAGWENFSPLSDTPGVLEGSGGSSITQQLVKNVYIPLEDRAKRGAEGVDRKLKETIYAIELTRRYDKEQILEWYINQISYGGLYNGVQAASLGYFGKAASELTLAEAALLAGIPQSPAAYDPVNHPEVAQARRNEILDLMRRQGPIQIGENRFYAVTDEALTAAKAEAIDITLRRFPIEAPHFVLQYVEPQLEQVFGRESLLRDGLIVTTTLDLDMQKAANELLEEHILEFEEISNSRNGAVMIIDPKTGEVLSLVGSRDYFREDIEGKNNNVTACNSPGSSFKPFAYITTFKELDWGPGTVILDTPVEYPDPGGGKPFVPRNPSGNFQGPITLRNALGNSLNIPANKVAAAVGADKIVTQARQLGFLQTFRLQERGGCSSSGGYGPAIATGGVDVTLEEMVYGYSVLANDGLMNGQTPFVEHGVGERQVDPIAILQVTDNRGQVIYDVQDRVVSERVIEPEYPFLIWDILTDSQARCITFNCGLGVPNYTVAVKTGTSEPYDPDGPNAFKIGDTWGFGFSPDLVVGVWAGNSDNSPITNIFSTSISFRAMSDIYVMAHEGIEVTAYTRPEGIVEEEVCVPSGMRPSEICGKTTKDLFVEDTLPEEEDDWWQRVKIDRRNGQLASPFTPRQYVEEEVMLVLPQELLETEEDRERAEEWAEALGISLAPTEISTAGGSIDAGGGGGIVELAALIVSPESGDLVSGVVEVRGRAASSRFINYRLQYGSGIAPTNWKTLEVSNDAVLNGTLGEWDTRNLTSGVYTLQLQVLDGNRGSLVTTVSVIVDAD